MSFYKNKNVLITGAAGITGHSAVKRLLDEGAHVRATVFSKRKLNVSHKNLEVIQCNLMNPFYIVIIRQFRSIEICCFNFIFTVMNIVF